MRKFSENSDAYKKLHRMNDEYGKDARFWKNPTSEKGLFLEHAFWTIPDKPEEQSGIPRETQYRKGRESRTEQTWLDIQQI